MKHSFVIIGFFILFFTTTFGATATIDQLKQAIITQLQSNKAYVSQFNDFFKDYDSVVYNFFDNNNNLSLQTHVNLFEKELKRLYGVVQDKRFASIKTILASLHTDVADLITTLRGYFGSKNSLGMCWSLNRFKFLLPKPVRKRGDLSLFWSIHHRLGC